MSDLLPPDLMRHVHACDNATLPGQRLRFRLGDATVGWVLPETAALLAAEGVRREDGAMVLDDPAALYGIGRAVQRSGACRFRDEVFDVRAQPDGPVLAQLDRAALPVFGALAVGVHLNALVPREDGLHMWIARRSITKLLDPGKLDHMVGGGIASGYGPADTLVKEAAEEAALPAALAAEAVHRTVMSYAMERREGLRRDVLHCYDLMLPESFVPRPMDGEVAGFELWPLPRVLDTLRRTDDFKFNVGMVLIDLFLRLGVLPDGDAIRASLRWR